MSKLVPKRWFSWDFRLESGSGVPAAEIILSAWRERGSVVVAGVHYTISRKRFTGPFVLENAGREIARAVKPSALRQEFTISHQATEYTLKRVSWWRAEFALLSGGRHVGKIAPESWLTRRAIVTLPDTMPLWLQAFIVWLAALMWKRDADATAAGAPPGG